MRDDNFIRERERERERDRERERERERECVCVCLVGQTAVATLIPREISLKLYHNDSQYI